VEQVMGDKTVFTRAASERKDLKVLQVVIELGPGFSAPVGLQVDVRVHRVAKAAVQEKAGHPSSTRSSSHE
jgi:hypothetical protein